MNAIVDPALLEEYKRRLEAHREEIHRHYTDHNSAFAHLSSFWADGNFKSYEQRESEAAQVIKSFMNEADVFISQLTHKAHLARQISEHRF